ncbi:MAG: GNAT family N-acetyltransferase [Candidatus Bathyarchaeota archaeon]|nr:GNAT family N-acetyltransferase [Candidatus Bathyarchaeota archaeon]
MTIVFRDATESDFEILSRIYEKPYDGLETARKFVELYLGHYFWKLVEADGKIVGGLIWFPRENPELGWAEILDVWIDESYRRRRLGFRLIIEVIKNIESHFESFGHKAKCVILFTSENNISARRLYEKAGFKKVGYGGYVADDGTRELLYSLNF